MNRYCPFCKGEMEHGSTTFTADLEFGVVVVRQVPAIVCSLCGADWIEDDIAEHLEKIVNSAREKHLMIEVCNWQNQLEAI
jgi:YgiT-type zinc finger domain-containing protein